MSIPNNRSGQGLPKRPVNPGKLPNRPASGSLPNRPNPSLPNKDSLPSLPEFNTPSPRSEEEIVRSRTRSESSQGRRGQQSEEYNFDTGRAALQQKPSFQNEFDDENDDTFKDLSIDEQLDYEEKEDQEERRKAAKKRAAERRAEQELERLKAERQAEREKTLDDDIVFDEYDDELPDSLEDDQDVQEEIEEEEVKPSKAKARKKKKDLTDENTKDEYGQDVFIDEEKLELKPFGSKKGKKKKTKEHDYDPRKNKRTNETIARFVFLALFLFIVGLGVKNTFFPAPALSEEEITGIVSETVDLTNYPVERGGGFAKDFVQAYLSTDAEESNTNQSVLNYFYTGEISGEEAAATNRTMSNEYSQTVLYGPTIYESQALTDYSARYTIGAVVRASNLDPENPQNDAKWIFMNVNVYYSEDTDSFTITPDSPAVLPNPPVGSVTDLPTELALGEETTDTEIINKVQPAVYGFLNGYKQSSTQDHSTLDQYIMSGSSTSLEQGLNNEYEFAGGSVEDGTEYIVYSDPEDPGLLKVKATVTWVSGSENNNMNFTSTYVIFLREQSNGMYLVERFQPFYFVADEEEMEAEAAEAASEEEATIEE